MDTIDDNIDEDKLLADDHDDQIDQETILTIEKTNSPSKIQPETSILEETDSLGKNTGSPLSEEVSNISEDTNVKEKEDVTTNIEEEDDLLDVDPSDDIESGLDDTIEDDFITEKEEEELLADPPIETKHSDLMDVVATIKQEIEDEEVIDDNVDESSEPLIEETFPINKQEKELEKQTTPLVEEPKELPTQLREESQEAVTPLTPTKEEPIQSDKPPTPTIEEPEQSENLPTPIIEIPEESEKPPTPTKEEPEVLTQAIEKSDVLKKLLTQTIEEPEELPTPTVEDPEEQEDISVQPDEPSSTSVNEIDPLSIEESEKVPTQPIEDLDESTIESEEEMEEDPLNISEKSDVEEDSVVETDVSKEELPIEEKVDPLFIEKPEEIKLTTKKEVKPLSVVQVIAEDTKVDSEEAESNDDLPLTIDEDIEEDTTGKDEERDVPIKNVKEKDDKRNITVNHETMDVDEPHISPVKQEDEESMDVDEIPIKEKIVNEKRGKLSKIEEEEDEESTLKKEDEESNDVKDKLSNKKDASDAQDNSDLEIFSAPDEVKEPEQKQKRRGRRRKREIEIIQRSEEDGSDDSGDESSSKRSRDNFGSPGPNSPSHSASREPRSCVLNQRQKKRPLSRLLEQLLKNLEKKDHNQFFAWPVTDNYAPNYSKIIKKPMDFSTMKQKIDENEYETLNCFISDFKLMCQNAVKYNKSGTVYHKAAKKLLHVGMRQLEPEKLRPLGNILTYMYEIPIRELGFDMGKMDLKAMRQRRTSSSGDPHEEKDQLSPEDIKLKKMEKARTDHRRKLAKKAFPRMDNKGFTSLKLLVDNDGMIGTSNQRPVSLGVFTGRIAHGTGTLVGFKEDRRNLVKGVKALNYGAFGSYAPSYDSTFATISKEESHLLYHCYAEEMGLNSGESNLRFSPDSPWSVIYDMEALFPRVNNDKAETESPPPPENKNVKIDVEQLKSLSDLGIDVDFLTDIEEDILNSQEDFGLQNSLVNNVSMLKKLEDEQRERLSQPIPSHLSMVAKPSLSEQEVARAVVANLREMISKVQPRHVAPVTSLRKAMGVTLDHLDTPMSTDDFHEPVHHHEEPTSNGFKEETAVSVDSK